MVLVTGESSVMYLLCSKLHYLVGLLPKTADLQIAASHIQSIPDKELFFGVAFFFNMQ